MRSIVGLLIAAVIAIPSAAMAAEFSSCWVTTELHPVYGTEQQVTRCRIVGGETIDYASDSDVPATLMPNLGTDLTGQCWYLTTASTAYVVLVQYGDGSADIGLLTDPSDPSSLVAIGPTLPRCTSEPMPATDPAADAWDYVMSYIHPPPTPELNPQVGDGVTGLATFVGVQVPDDHDATLSSGLSTLRVEIDVEAVKISWGDGETNTYPADADLLAGYPDGAAQHIYETKDPEGATITVAYDWTARWRLIGGSWTTLPVPDTDTTVIYPIAEVVSRLAP